MRTLRVVLTLTLLFTISASAAETKPAAALADLPEVAQARISATLGQDGAQFYARPVAGGFQAASGALATHFTADGMEVSNGSTRWGLALKGYGYGDALRSVSAVAPQANKNRVEYRRGTMTEWYVNGPMGLEQGFTIVKRPNKANGLLTIALETSGNLTAVDDTKVGLTLKTTDGRAALRYAGLTAYDAAGKNLHASMRVLGQQLLLQVDDGQARYPVVVDPVVQLAKLTESDGKAGDGLGVSVAISGNVIVAGTFSNAAYVFVKPPSGWKDMTQTAKLTPSDGLSGTYLSVAVSGDLILIGEPSATVNGNQFQGAVYAFVKPPNGWKDMPETAKLVASDGAPGDAFGLVSISGTTAVVGALNATVNGGLSQGAAYVFTKPKKGGAVSERLILNETAKLTASDGQAGSRFGSAVSISGNTIAVGAETAAPGGEAYIFVKPPTGWATMTETGRLTSSDGGGGFGSSISTNGNTVAVGAPVAHDNGAVYVYVEPETGWADLLETAQLLAARRGWDFSHSVAIDASGSVIAAGAPEGNGHQNGAGDVFIFLKPASGWQTTDEYKYRVFATDGLHGDAFGVSASINGKTLVVGAQGAQIGGNPGQGAGYVFAPQ